MRCHVVLALLAGSVSSVAYADLVRVDVTGTVEFNDFVDGPFLGVPEGAPASISFVVDSEDFEDSSGFPTRGYSIDQSSFMFTAGDASSALADPFPDGETPYFVMRNNDPAVDGVFISTDIDGPVGLAMPMKDTVLNFLATLQGGDAFSSLDILDAVGTYELSQVSTFDWTVGVGPGTAMGMVFDSFTISIVPAPGAAGALLLAGVVAGRRRRT